MEAEYKINKVLPYFVALLVSFLFFVVNLNVWGPTIQGDEGGYLSYAAAFSGYMVDNATSYHPGYSILISPAFLWGDSPATVFLLVKFINSLLWGGTTILVYNILKIAYSRESEKKLLAVALVSMLYPAWLSFSGYAFSENGFVLVYLLSVYLIFMMAQRGSLYWILFGLCLGFLFVIHPKSIPVLVAASIVSTMLAYKKGEWIWLVCSVFITVAFISIYKYVAMPWLTSSMAIGDFRVENHYPSSLKLIAVFSSLQTVHQWIVVLVGQSLYLILSTLGFVLFPLFDSYYYIKRKSIRAVINEEDLRYLGYAYIGLSLLGTLLLSSLFMTDGIRVDHQIYGRYNEGVLLPILALSLLLFSVRKILMSIIIAVVACSFFIVSADGRIDLVPLNITGLWQHNYIKNSSGSWYEQNFTMGLLLLLPLFAFYKSLRMRLMYIASIFFFASITFVNKVHIPNNNAHGDRQDNALYIRDNFSSNTCVALDRKSSRNWWHPTFIPQYAFYLYSYDFKQLTQKNWYAKCDGPLLSWDESIAEQFSNVYPVMKEKKDGPILWLKGKRELKFNEVVQFNDFFSSRHLLKKGWYKTERWGVWSGRTALIEVNLPEECQSGVECRLSLVYRVFNASQISPKYISLTLNKKLVIERDIRTGVVYNALIDIPSGIVGERGLLSIEVDSPQSLSPLQVNLSLDERILGLGISSIELIKAASR
ncbi:MAG: hypothetical protein JKY50_03380 [Oleispira sp.]|nr:hypothetical protein [Oleispira sp.]